MVTELLGVNMYTLLKYCGGDFTVNTALKITIELLHLIEHIHERGFLIKNISLENILIGYDPDSRDTFHIVNYTKCRQFKKRNG